MLLSLFRSLINTQRTWMQRHNERIWLLNLDSHALKDIGISANDAWREANKPFWKK